MQALLAASTAAEFVLDGLNFAPIDTVGGSSKVKSREIGESD